MSASAIELPLFPLNVVLFPGVVLPLHIFEPRYRQMIADCQVDQRPFGIVLAQPGSEPLQEIPYSVGTMVEIRDLHSMEDGRYVLMAMGIKRFRILSHHRQKPYLSGLKRTRILARACRSRQKISPSLLPTFSRFRMSRNNTSWNLPRQSNVYTRK